MPLTLATIDRMLAEMIDSGNHQMDKFRDKLATNPASAFEWSQDAFTAAANIKVAGEATAWIAQGRAIGYDDAAAIKELVDEALSKVMRGARSPARSTSPQSNLIEQETVAAWALLHDRISSRL